MSIYLFLDESGNLNFSPTGTKFYCFGVMTTHDPKPLNQALTDLRYDLLDEGLELECLHASEDRQAVRDRVFESLVRVGGFEFDAVIVEKNKTHPSLYDHAHFYPKLSNYLLSHCLTRHRHSGERIVVITDRLPLKRKRKAAEKAIKGYIRQNLPEDRDFTLMHHASGTHPGLQAADYLMWAVYRKWQSADLRSYNLIKKFVRSEFDIFRTGRISYY